MTDERIAELMGWRSSGANVGGLFAKVRTVVDEAQAEAQRKQPCGECHLQPGERCDICGALQGT
jgi:hypothetical protein